MQKHKKHVHSRRKKTLKKVGWTVLAVVILLAVGSWAWGSTLVQSRVQASFGNNAAYQKRSTISNVPLPRRNMVTQRRILLRLKKTDGKRKFLCK
ncbi:hypothetical protein [Ligilactobacillus acidipiscis]|uniref:hypothetical protein n=1 Tax=Ligilactobacillus acidipiscis TaxID=89059 RepID=UPI0007054082|nr:hypothetical protein [Ligilactobacillus acidipiscis]GAW63315.1 hypothetical protein Lacidipiscis_00497 [Ligilactobacillus acidipiscis]